MSLTDGDVALLARQAVDLLDPESAVHIDPADPVDPYRLGSQSWLVRTPVAGVYVSAADSAAEVLARLIDQMSEYGSESAPFWGRAFPACPGHRHPAQVAVDGAEVVLRCPQSVHEVARIRPAVPG